MKKYVTHGVVLVAALAYTAFTAASAGAEDELRKSAADCTFTAEFINTPGLTPTASKFSFVTVEPAAVHCEGKINGHTVTGAGTYEESGSMYGDCNEGSGKGSYTTEIPTTGGVQRVSGWFHISYQVPTGTEWGPTIDATFQVVSTEGDCFNTPMTGLTLTQTQKLYTRG